MSKYVFINALAGLLMGAAGAHNLGFFSDQPFPGWGLTQVMAVGQLIGSPAFLYFAFKNYKRAG